MTIIKFKSTPENYKKEYYGLKNNTARFIESDDGRLKILHLFKNNELDDHLIILIENTKTGNYFDRIVKDVTFYKHLDAPELTIITWEHSNKNEVHSSQ